MTALRVATASRFFNRQPKRPIVREALATRWLRGRTRLRIRHDLTEPGSAHQAGERRTRCPSGS